MIATTTSSKTNGWCVTHKVGEVSQVTKMDSVLNRQRSSEETSYAAAVTGKGDPGKVIGSWGDGMRNSSSFDAAFPPSGSTSITKVSSGSLRTSASPAVCSGAGSTTNGSVAAVIAAPFAKPVAVEAPAYPELPPPKVIKVSVACQTSNETRTQGQMTDSNSKVCKDLAVEAKLCSCDHNLSRPTAAVEFHGDHFKFEAALAQLVANLGISFIDEGFELKDGVDL